MPRRPKPPYVPFLMLRAGQRVSHPETSRPGVIERAITSKRYMVAFADASEVVSSNRLRELSA